MIKLLQHLGATIQFDEQNNIVDVDTSTITSQSVDPDIMKKMRASILVMGPLLARYGKADIAVPGGCVFGVVKGIDKDNQQGNVEKTIDKEHVKALGIFFHYSLPPLPMAEPSRLSPMLLPVFLLTNL